MVFLQIRILYRHLEKLRSRQFFTTRSENPIFTSRRFSSAQALEKGWYPDPHGHLEFFKVSIGKIISGGQTGVDQTVLEAALAVGVEIGGWCPPNRECETGKIPAEFPLVPTAKARSDLAPDIPRSLRTELNVRDSDATCIITASHLVSIDKGTEWTASCAARFGKPLLSVDAYDDAAGDKIMEWIEKHGIETLNVAGPSESTVPGIGARTFDLVLRVALATKSGTSERSPGFDTIFKALTFGSTPIRYRASSAEICLALWLERGLGYLILDVRREIIEE